MQLNSENKQFDFVKGEIILMNKPLNWTSFDVVNKIRGLISIVTGIKKIKIGHAGTLDPLATGLLILCTGKFTKRIEEFQDLDKEYTGTFTLGATTPSFDLETQIDKTYETKHIDSKLITGATKKFIGTFEQMPPIFSAKKIKGKKAYELAREGKKVDIKPKVITIDEFDITNIDMPLIGFKVICHKGTYIRSLAYDFGKELESGAHLSELCRTRIGTHKIEDAYSIEDIELILRGLTK